MHRVSLNIYIYIVYYQDAPSPISRDVTSWPDVIRKIRFMMISITCCLKCSVFRSYDLGFVFPTQKSSQSQPLALYITFRTFEHESACPSEGRKDLIRRVFCSLRAGSLVSTFRHRYTGDGEKNGTTKSDFSSSHSSRRLAFSVPTSEPACRLSVL